MKKIFILILILIPQIYALIQWANLHHTLSFHYSSFDLNLRLIQDIHNDPTLPLWQVRLFHNKLLGAFFDIFALYLQFWNLPFLATFLSLTCIPGLLLGFYYFIATWQHAFSTFTMKIQTVLLLFLLILPFLEIFQINQIHAFTRVLLIALSLLLWSTFGYWKFLHKVTTGKVIFLALLILISILFQRFVL